MTISKKISLITIFSIALSTNLIVMPFWDTVKQPEPTPFDSIKKNLNNQNVDFHQAYKEISNEIKNSLSDKAKFVIGAATIGVGGTWFVTKVFKKAVALSIYGAGLFAVVTAGTILLEDVKNPLAIMQELQEDAEHAFNQSMLTANEVAKNATAISNKINKPDKK